LEMIFFNIVDCEHAFCSIWCSRGQIALSKSMMLTFLNKRTKVSVLVS
jgi:hypothetical protein